MLRLRLRVGGGACQNCESYCQGERNGSEAWNPAAQRPVSHSGPHLYAGHTRFLGR